jgi:tRNA G46 methylase TrmB
MTFLPLKNYSRSLGHLLNRKTMAAGPDWSLIFGSQAPVELEIGFGNGELLRRTSLANHGRNYIGLEIAWTFRLKEL